MQGKQQNAEWYDKVYDPALDSNYNVHYTRSGYYITWSIIADRLLRYRDGQQSGILDIGCGVGQFAHFLWDKGRRDYAGIDFSGTAINEARKRCPGFTFMQADATKSVYVWCGYSVVTCLEFLEHIDDDLELLVCIPAGTKVYATVPNFLYTSHVRHFADADSVKARYGSLFSEFRVDLILLNEEGMTLFLFDGVRV